MLGNNGAFLFATFMCAPDHIAPDGSEIRLLPQMDGGGACHCRLPDGKTSTAVKHRHVEEIWYCISGSGVIRFKEIDKPVVELVLEKGTVLSIKPNVAFQFKNTGSEDLDILIITMPKWPGPEEAIYVEDLFDEPIPMARL